jgi:hypothetical protein
MVGDSHAPAIVLGQGATEAAQYRDEKAGYDAYVVWQYMEPQLVFAIPLIVNLLLFAR